MLTGPSPVTLLTRCLHRGGRAPIRRRPLLSLFARFRAAALVQLHHRFDRRWDLARDVQRRADRRLHFEREALVRYQNRRTIDAGQPDDGDELELAGSSSESLSPTMFVTV